MNIALVALGILSALALARDGFNVSFNDFLEGIVRAYDDVAKDLALALFEPMIQPVLAKLRAWLTLDLQLYPHWKHLFVLLWLLFGKTAPAISGGGLTRWLAYAWGLTCALFGAVVDGTVPLTDGAVGFGFTAGCFLFVAGLLAPWLSRVKTRASLWLWCAGMAFLVLGAVWNTVIAWHIVPLPFISIPPPGGLLLTANFVATIAFFLLLFSPREDGDKWTMWLFHPVTQSGLSILSVFGGAMLIVWFGQT